MFERGDILRVKTKWLSEAEKADPKYRDKLYFVRDCWDGKVEVACESDNFLGHSVYVWPEETMYWVGHVDPESL